MYEGQISSAAKESGTLRTQLADCLRRYEEQTKRLRDAQASLLDAATKHTQLTLKLKASAAEKKVADDLEHILTDALRKQEDKYETLEISFDVLESAYSFLAAELVRTEHALEDALQAQKQLRASEGEGETEEHVVADVADDAHSTADTEPVTEDESERIRHMRTDSALSASSYSVFSDRSWPDTPSLTRTIDSVSSLRSPISSPIVQTPPLPMLHLEPVRSSNGYASRDICDSPSPIGPKFLPEDPEDIFGSWSLESLPTSPV